MKHRPAFAVLAALTLLLCASTCLAKTVYVKWDSPGPTLNGTSWTNAYHTITAGINGSASGDEIWVAKGTYSETATLKAGTGLYGGFAGTETARDQRNFCRNLTIVGRDARPPDGATNTTRIDGFTIRGSINLNNSSPVIANNRIVGRASIDLNNASSPVIINNVITNTDGIRCMGSSSPLIVNNTIVHGPAVSSSAISSNSSGPVTIINNIIAFNRRGINRTSGTFIMRNNCVYGNVSGDYYGVSPGTGDISVDPLLADLAYGNLHIQPSSPCRDTGDDTAVQVGWTDMDAEARIQGSHVDIGADESDGTTWPTGPSVTVRVSLIGNDANDGSSWAQAKRTVQAGVDTASALGGEVWVAAGDYATGVSVRTYAYVYGGFAGTETSRSERNWNANRSIIRSAGFDPGYRQSTLDGFTISGGSGIYCGSSSPIITNNTITGCSNTTSGPVPNAGGILCESASAFITNNIITGNTADGGYSAGGICIFGGTSELVISNNIIARNFGGYAGAVFCYSTSAIFTNNTITNNCSAGNDGGGFYLSSASPNLSNNIIAFNSSGISNDVGTPVLRNNCVYGNVTLDYLNVAPGTGDISADPLLAGMEYGSKPHVQPGSPCINAGWNDAQGIQSADLDGQTRVQDGTIDIGVDESDGTTWPAGPNIIVRVSPSGNDANDGSSWALAKRTIQAGVNGASALGGDVWVKAGTYVESVTLQPYVHLYGGFAGTESSRSERNWAANVTAIGDGTTTAFVTGASGHLVGSLDGFTLRKGILTLKRSGSRIANNTIGGIRCEHSSPVIVNNRILGGSGIDCQYSSSPLIANNAIIGNNNNSGAGIYCSVNSNATIINNTIAGNNGTNFSGGGGISCSDSSPSIRNNIIAFNSSGIQLATTYSTPVLQNNCVYGNARYDYSGISAGTGDISVDPLLPGWEYGNSHIQPGSPCRDAGDDTAIQSGWTDVDAQARVQGSHVDIGADESDGTSWSSGPNVIVRVSPTGNDSNSGSRWSLAKRTVQGGIDAAAALGGEVWVRAGTYNQKVTMPAFTHLYGGFAGTESSTSQRDLAVNETILDGGATGTVVTIPVGHRVNTVDGFTIRGGSTGGVDGTYSGPVISNNMVTGNVGTGVRCNGSGVVSHNTITQNGRGVYAQSGVTTIANNTIARNTLTTGTGAGIYASGPSVSIVNNTITGNTSPTDGGAIAYTGSSSVVTISNNILAFNSSGIYRQTSGTATLRNNDVYGNTSYNYSGVTAGVGDISLDPLLVDRTGGDYHLTASSPCLNAGWDSAAGLPSTDMDGEGRISALTVDIGADEYWPITALLSDGKKTADGADVSLKGLTVSAAFNGSFYIEAADRSSGIRVDKANHGISAGTKVNVSGTLGTNDNGERFIQAAAATPCGVGAVESILLPNRSIGGGDWLPVGVGQNGILGAADLNNIGLLVTTTGKVTYVGSGFFYLDDGSHLDDGSGYLGVRVSIEGQTMPGLDTYVKVTGVSSCYKAGTGLYRLIRATAIL